MQYNTQISLPAPAISEQELTSISKYANAGQSAMGAGLKNNAGTHFLIGEYS